MLILDSTALLDLLLNTRNARRLREHLIGAEDPGELIAPASADLEIVEALHRYGLLGEISESRARQALEDLHKLPLERREHHHLNPRLLALRDAGASARHTAYLALAEELGAPILTSDPRMAPVQGQDVRILLEAEEQG